jgi:hypothetical protein
MHTLHNMCGLGFQVVAISRVTPRQSRSENAPRRQTPRLVCALRLGWAPIETHKHRQRLSGARRPASPRWLQNCQHAVTITTNTNRFATRGHHNCEGRDVPNNINQPPNKNHLLITSITGAGSTMSRRSPDALRTARSLVSVVSSSTSRRVL